MRRERWWRWMDGFVIRTVACGGDFGISKYPHVEHVFEIIKFDD